jgi:hypothetical protein
MKFCTVMKAEEWITSKVSIWAILDLGHIQGYE